MYYNMSQLNQWIWLIMAAIAAALPLPLIKKYNTSNNHIYLIGSAVSYMILILSYVIILRTNNMITIYPFLKILSIVIVILFGWFVFHENFTTKNVIGIILGLIAMYLLLEK
jgi:multidrug transporter EmrE-like cation transporter